MPLLSFVIIVGYFSNISINNLLTKSSSYLKRGVKEVLLKIYMKKPFARKGKRDSQKVNPK